ncbi:3-deoxy-manno-octulosonate cytidylyltransferase [Synechococcus sp. M16CYN]|uniref:3-deoxy-manno-octulosonate cytidylyltransferase n=1 Tax=Synechococcus sp. M16CYN TaxID=3103139 RepID=UPI0032554DD1
MAIQRCLVAVPARLQSSRLPNKLLADIGGKPMIRRVLDHCRESSEVDAVILCTDSQELRQHAIDWGFPVLMTANSCSSGSERIASVADKLIAAAWGAPSPVPDQTGIINVQGDQPFIESNIIDDVATNLRRLDPTTAVVTPIYSLKPETIHDPNVVKVLLAHDGRALYFSRSAIPHVRNVDRSEWYLHTTFWGHVGIYGFRGDVLVNWNHLPVSPLEGLERLEQLRLIEAGHTIATFKVQGNFLSVDTAEQLEQARAIV